MAARHARAAAATVEAARRKHLGDVVLEFYPPDAGGTMDGCAHPCHQAEAWRASA